MQGTIDQGCVVSVALPYSAAAGRGPSARRQTLCSYGWGYLRTEREHADSGDISDVMFATQQLLLLGREAFVCHQFFRCRSRVVFAIFIMISIYFGGVLFLENIECDPK